MGLNQLYSLYERRRASLVSLLEKDPQIDPARQHQIYGAICEIDILLKTITHLKDQQVLDDFELEAKGKGENQRRV